MERYKCKCGKIATEWYAPAYDGKEDENSYFCDDCVPRGCSCNWEHMDDEDVLPPPTDKPWKWVIIKNKEGWDDVNEGEMWTLLDEKGREHPCCEYWYSEDGFEIYTEERKAEIREKMNEEFKKRNIE